jgi:hypothetical protein
MADIKEIQSLYSQCDDIKIEMKEKSIEYIKEILSKQDKQEITLFHKERGYEGKDVSVSVLCHINSECMLDYVGVDKIRMISNRLFFDCYFRYENEPLDDKRAEDLAKIAFAIERWLNKNNINN